MRTPSCRSGGSICVYRVDAADRITYVNEGWHLFAEANDVPGLDPGGQPIWDFISGRDVAHLWQVVLARARETGRRLELPFRCDSPAARRFLRMEIVPLAEGAVEFRSYVEREEARAPVSLAPAEPSAEVLTMCSWCKRVDIDGWVEVEDAVAALDLLGDAPTPGFSHGLCQECAGAVMVAAGAPRS